MNYLLKIFVLFTVFFISACKEEVKNTQAPDTKPKSTEQATADIAKNIEQIGAAVGDEQAAKKASEALQEFGKAVETHSDKIGRELGEEAQKLEKTAQEFGREVGQEAEKLGNKLQEAGQEIGNAAQNFVNEAQPEVEKAAKNIGEAAEKFGSDMKKAGEKLLEQEK
ncbi:MAG: hypothetical protein J6M05_04710 [Cardiobacteriaceae bacterium]|nr:hypothetical protein [Cardiobacteriaceae bacterium]